MAEDSTAVALESALISEHEEDSHGEMANVVDGLFAVARALQHGFKGLGNADAATPMGALEAHGAALLEAAQTVTDAVRGLGDAAEEIAGGLGAIARSLDRIADALQPRGEPRG